MISQSTTVLRNGQPQIELTVPYAVPPIPLGKSGSPFTNSLAPSQATTGGSIVGDTFHYYYFVAIDSDGKQGKPSTAIEVYVPVGTSTNTITLAGPTPFDVDAINYEIYRSDGDPYGPFKIVSSTAVPSPGTDFTFTDTGISLTTTLMPDGMFTGVALYWRVQGESGWKFAAKTIDRTQTSLKFAVPYNVQGKVLEIQLRSLGPGGAEMNEDLAALSTYTVTGVLGAGINVGGVSREWQLYEGSGGVGIIRDVTAAADRVRVNSSGKVGIDGAPTTDWISVQGNAVLDSARVVKATIDPTLANVLTKGSIPPSTFTAFSYTATTTSITWSWTGLTIYRADGTTTAVTNGSQAITGLSSNTQYFFYPYYDEALAAIGWVSASGSGSPTYAYGTRTETQAQGQNLQARVPLANGPLVAFTTASGTGGGSGGGSGICLRVGMLVETEKRGIQPIENVELDERLATRSGFTTVKAIKIMPADEFVRIVLEDGNAIQVTPTHELELISGDHMAAAFLVLSDCIVTRKGAAQIRSLEMIREASRKVVITCSPDHQFFAGEKAPEILAHNFFPC